MAFQVQPATYGDLDELADVIVSAHIEDELISTMMGNVAHGLQVQWYADEFRKVWEDPSARYYKVTETSTHKIVAMARFHYPRKMTAEERSTRESNMFGLLPDGSNVNLCQEFFEKLEHYEGQHLDKETTYFVNYLATLPQYHRKGLGKRLIDVCLNAADEARAKTFLIATPAGSGLYRKLGFRVIDRASWDTMAHGGDGSVTWLCMIRQPDFSGDNCSATAI